MNPPIVANTTATATFIVFVTSVLFPTRSRTVLLWNERRCPSRRRSQKVASRNRGNTIPKTYASPSAADPASDDDSADSVMTPASTGAQHDDATPEKIPRAKTPAVSLRSGAGEWMNDGKLHERPDSDTAAIPSSSRPPAM